MQTEQDLERLVHAYTAPLLRYCTALLGSEAEAQDAVQSTFIKAWLRRSTLRGGGQDNERAWLYRIAYRTALDMLRAARRAEQRALAQPPGPAPAGPPASAPNCGKRWTPCPPLDRALVLERVLEGMDYAALAKVHRRPEAYLRTPLPTAPNAVWPTCYERREPTMTPDRDELLLQKTLQEGLHPADRDLWPAVAEALPGAARRQRRRARALRVAVCLCVPVLLAAGALLGRAEFTNLRENPRPSFAPENNTGYAIRYDQTAYELPEELNRSLLESANGEADGGFSWYISTIGSQTPPLQSPGTHGYDSWLEMTADTGLPLVQSELPGQRGLYRHRHPVPSYRLDPDRRHVQRRSSGLLAGT